jgi:hypothetical protein
MAARFCVHCGYAVEDEDSYCYHCHRRVMTERYRPTPSGFYETGPTPFGAKKEDYFAVGEGIAQQRREFDEMMRCTSGFGRPIRSS